MNEEMISYCANMERRVNALYIMDMYRQEGGSQICPHRYEWTQSNKCGNIEVHTYVCSLCGKTYKEVVHLTTESE